MQTVQETVRVGSLARFAVVVGILNVWNNVGVPVEYGSQNNVVHVLEMIAVFFIPWKGSLASTAVKVGIVDVGFQMHFPYSATLVIEFVVHLKVLQQGYKRVCLSRAFAALIGVFGIL